MNRIKAAGTVFKSLFGDHTSKKNIGNHVKTNAIFYILFLTSLFDLQKIVEIIIMFYWKLHPIKIGSSGRGSFVSVGDDTYIWTPILNDRLNLPKKLSLGKVETVAFGHTHLLILVQNEIYVYGGNADGQLGVHDEHNRKYFCKLDLDLVTEISCGAFHSMAICLDQSVYSWGNNTCGQLGLGHYHNQYSPKKLNLKMVKVCTCDFFSMGLTADGEVYTWGSNQFHQLGLGHNNRQCLPHKLNLSGIKEICCGNYVSFAIGFGGQMYYWGYNFFEESECKSRPQKLDLKNVIMISCSGNYVLTLNTNGEVYNCDDKKYLDGVVQISSGSDHSMALTVFGDVYVWGKNTDGRLGLGHCSKQSAPKKIEF